MRIHLKNKETIVSKFAKFNTAFRFLILL